MEAELVAPLKLQTTKIQAEDNLEVQPFNEADAIDLELAQMDLYDRSCWM